MLRPGGGILGSRLLHQCCRGRHEARFGLTEAAGVPRGWRPARYTSFIISALAPPEPVVATVVTAVVI
jgi:hypothetical protein